MLFKHKIYQSLKRNFSTCLLLIIIALSFSNCRNYSTHPIKKGLVIKLSDPEAPFKKVKLVAHAPDIIELTKANSDSLLNEESLVIDYQKANDFNVTIREGKD